MSVIKVGGNIQAAVQQETAIINNKRNKQSLDTVKKLLPQLNHTRGEVLDLLGVSEGSGATKIYKLFNGREVEATHVVVPYESFKNYTDTDPQDSLVAIHPLNKRNQKALSKTALADLVESALQHGIQGEGLAIEIDGRYEIIDSSRRFAAARIAKCDLPLWVFPAGTELSDSEARMLAHITTLKRALSYREEGKHIYDFAVNLGIDHSKAQFSNAVQRLFLAKLEAGDLDDDKLDFPVVNDGDTYPTNLMLEYVNFNEAFYEAIRIEFGLTSSDRTIRRYLDAAMVSDALITLFPDYEGISNKKYPALKKACRSIATKMGKPFTTNKDNELQYYASIEPIVERWLAEVNDRIVINDALPVSKQHEQIEATINSLLVEKSVVTKPEPSWSEPEVLSKVSETKYCTVRTNRSGRIHEIKLSRPTDSHLEIHKLVAEKYEQLSDEQRDKLLAILK